MSTYADALRVVSRRPVKVPLGLARPAYYDGGEDLLRREVRDWITHALAGRATNLVEARVLREAIDLEVEDSVDYFLARFAREDEVALEALVLMDD